MGTRRRDETLTGSYDPDDDASMSAFVVRLVAVATGRRPTDLEPLGRVVDPDALDALFEPRVLYDADTAVSVSFAYEGYDVEIEADGTVRLLEE